MAAAITPRTKEIFVANPNNPTGTLVGQKALDRFIGGLGMPRSLSAVGIKPESFGRIAEGAMGTPWVPRNPRPITSPAQVREILDLAA